MQPGIEHRTATTNKFIVCSGLTRDTRHPLLTLWVAVFVNIDRPKKRWREGKRSLFKQNKNKKGKVEVEGEVMGLAEKVCGGRSQWRRWRGSGVCVKTTRGWRCLLSLRCVVSNSELTHRCLPFALFQAKRVLPPSQSPFSSIRAQV